MNVRIGVHWSADILVRNLVFIQAARGKLQVACDGVVFIAARTSVSAIWCSFSLDAHEHIAVFVRFEQIRVILKNH